MKLVDPMGILARVANMSPWAGRKCFFCNVPKYWAHAAGCQWQNARECFDKPLVLQSYHPAKQFTIDGNVIKVYSHSDPDVKKYDYIYHPNHGVMWALGLEKVEDFDPCDPEGFITYNEYTNLCKSGVCKKIDEVFYQ